MQASIWRQDIIQNPVEPNPLKLGWKEEDGRWVPLLTMELPFQNVLYSLSNANAIPQTVSRVQGDDLVRRTNSSARNYDSVEGMNTAAPIQTHMQPMKILRRKTEA